MRVLDWCIYYYYSSSLVIKLRSCKFNTKTSLTLVSEELVLHLYNFSIGQLGCWFGFANVLKTLWRRFCIVLETFLHRLGDVFTSCWRRFCLVLKTSSRRSDCGLYDVLLRSWWSSFCYGYSVLKTSLLGLELGRGKTS